MRKTAKEKDVEFSAVDQQIGDKLTDQKSTQLLP